MRRSRLTIPTTPRTKSLLAAALAVAWLVSLPSALAAEHAAAPSGRVPLCGFVETASGQSELLDPSRTQVIDAVPRAGVPCGAWGSVASGGGALTLRLKDGFKIELGPGSFVQINSIGDQVTLFRGHVLLETDDGSSELRAITPNGRARLRHGKAILVYSHAREESQLVVLGGKGTLENRFHADARRVLAKSGEATSLNFKLLRVAPTTPRAVSVAALRAKLATLAMDEREEADALHAAHERGERKFPGGTEGGSEGDGISVAHQGRSPASAELNGHYAQNEPGAQDESLRKRFESRVVAGAPDAETLTHLKSSPKSGRNKGRAKIEIEDRGSKEDQEKRRLLEELSKIRAE